MPEGELALVREGATVEVTGPDGRTTAATIRQIAPVLDSTTRLAVVHVDLPADTGLKAGMFARVALDGASALSLTVPRSALVWRGGKAGVFLLNSAGTVTLTPVETGRQVDGAWKSAAGFRPATVS